VIPDTWDLIRIILLKEGVLMPKLKTKKALAKRVKVTKKKKILRLPSGRRHLLSLKDEKRKRFLRKKVLVSKTETATIKRALPYAF
jgi:large subunit ribosomal protein L35